eukprot:Pompholyxophrys_punicea_v1_NODE_104_length_3475_cov_32.445776.p3 type:complete len:252 gc:universal NODE_104_length_3475_cov_32.445776:546-1301(+)
MVTESNEAALQDGFVPIKFFIYDLARLKMQNLYTEITNNGGKVYAIKSDALFVNKDYEYKKPEFDSSSFEGIGHVKWKIVNLLSNLGEMAKIKENDKLEDIPTLKNIPIEDEFNRKEFANIFDSHTGVQVLAEYPGSGKTDCFEKYALSKKEGNKHKVLFVVPYNKMVMKIRKNDCIACTLYSLVGVRWDGCGDVKKKTHYNVEGIEVIVFDELFCYTVTDLIKIYKYIQSHSNIRFFATGDQYQNYQLKR